MGQNDENINEIDSDIDAVSNSIDIDVSNEPDWDESHEKVLVEWADKAQCFRWLHGKSYNNYRKRAMWFTIPVIIMSTVTGTANFAQERFDPSIKIIAVMIIGSINIFAGILTTVSQYLKINELLEAHRVTGISWSKFSRDIKMELSKDPRKVNGKSQRIPPMACLKKFKEEFDRLMEISPNIEESVIKLFMATFDEKTIRTNRFMQERQERILYDPSSSVPGWFRPCVKWFHCYECFTDPINNSNSKDDKESQTEVNAISKEIRYNVAQSIRSNGNFPVSRPEICDEIISVAVSKHPWMDETDDTPFVKKAIDKLNAQNKIKRQAEAEKQADIQKMNQVIEDKKKAQEEVERLNKLKEDAIKKDQIHNRIKNFINTFRSKMNRYPVRQEIKDDLSDIDNNDIEEYFLTNV